MKLWLLTHVKTLMGGGASYIFIGLGSVLLLQYWQADQLRSKYEEAASERDDALALAAEKDSVIATQSRQFSRQITTQKEQDNAESLIQSVPDSHHCSQSAPIGHALNWLREHQTPSAQADHDTANVPVPD